jgi:hypothetical protein
MMKLAKPVNFKTFINNVDMSPLLDPDETPESYINDSISDNRAYKSIWGDRGVCFYKQTDSNLFLFSTACRIQTYGFLSEHGI